MADVTNLDSDPIYRLLASGQAETLSQAEEMYLDAALPEAYTLLASDLSDEELGEHPLMVMYRSHGSRGWEDSIL